MKRTLVVVGMVVAVALRLASPATAAGPIVQKIHTELTGFVLEDCGDFQIILDLNHDETIKTYFDKNGLPTRSTIQFNFDATLTNSVTGKVAFEKGSSTIFIDLTGGSEHQAGLILQITVPGQGVVVLEVAEVSFDGSANASLGGQPLVQEGDSFFCSLLR